MFQRLMLILAQAAPSTDKAATAEKADAGSANQTSLADLGDIKSVDDLFAKGGALYQIVYDFIGEYGPKLIFALIWLVVGLILIKIISGLANRALKLKHIDSSVRTFVMSVLRLGLKILLFIMVLGALGVPTASLGFIFGAASLAIGFALKDTLQNFAGGVVILVLKPYRLGDYIEAQGFSGTVQEIQMFNTIMTTVDNRRIIIPNGRLSTSPMINFSSEDNRRLEVILGIGYGDDIEHARKVVNDIIESDDRTLHEPAPVIKVGDLAASSVDLVVRIWVARADYWNYRVEFLEKVKKAFDAEGISIPYPQSEITMRKAPD